MTLGSCACRSPFVNPLANLIEQNKLKGQGLARWSNVRSDKALTKAHISLEAPTLPLVPPPIEDFFIKFMKMFMKDTQARDWEQLEQQDCSLNAKTLDTYSEKSHIDFYHFCKQCEDYFETSGATGINYTLFTATFFCGHVSLK